MECVLLSLSRQSLPPTSALREGEEGGREREGEEGKEREGGEEEGEREREREVVITGMADHGHPGNANLVGLQAEDPSEKSSAGSHPLDLQAHHTQSTASLSLAPRHWSGNA